MNDYWSLIWGKCSSTIFFSFNFSSNNERNNFFVYCWCSKCQRACERLDTDEAIEAPEMIWFWPDRKETAADNGADADADANQVETIALQKNTSESNEEVDETSQSAPDTEEDGIEYDVTINYHTFLPSWFLPKMFVFSHFLVKDIWKIRNAYRLSTHNVLLLSLVWYEIREC